MARLLLAPILLFALRATLPWRQMREPQLPPLSKKRAQKCSVCDRSQRSLHKRLLTYRARSKTQCDAAGEIKLVQIMIVSDNPASTPERIAPISSIGGGDVGWRPFGLTAQAQVPAEVILCSAT